MFLHKHHTRPAYRELMGKQSKWNKPPWKEQNVGAGQSWQLWQGSWSSASPRRKEWELQGIPMSYDQTRIPQSALASRDEDSGTFGAIALGRQSGGFGDKRQEIQKALTASKRCDTKIRKLQETKEMRQLQMKHYREQLKAAFAKQKAQFERDLQAFDEEIAALQQQGEEAAQRIQQIALHGPTTMEVEGQEAAAERDWNELIGPSRAESAMTDFMRQAYAAAQTLHQTGGLGATPRPMGLGLMPHQVMESMVGCPSTVPSTSIPFPGVANLPPQTAPPSGTAAAPARPPGLTVPAPHGVPSLPEGSRGEFAGFGPPPATSAPVGEHAYSTSDLHQSRQGPYSRSPGAPSPAGRELHAAVLEEGYGKAGAHTAVREPVAPPRLDANGQGLQERLDAKRAQAKQSAAPHAHGSGPGGAGGEAAPSDGVPTAPGSGFLDDDSDDELDVTAVITAEKTT